MLDRYNIELEGKKALVIGRSDIVGKPIAEMLQQRNATVTLAHSKTKDLKRNLKGYDIIICAVGKQEFIKAEDLRYDKYIHFHLGKDEKEIDNHMDDIIRKIVVIDVGMNRNENGKLCGDVDYKSILNDKLTCVSYISKTPGGTGATTVSSLLKSCIQLFKYQNNI